MRLLKAIKRYPTFRCFILLLACAICFVHGGCSTSPPLSTYGPSIQSATRVTLKNPGKGEDVVVSSKQALLQIAHAFVADAPSGQLVTALRRPRHMIVLAEEGDLFIVVGDDVTLVADWAEVQVQEGAWDCAVYQTPHELIEVFDELFMSKQPFRKM